MSLNTALSSRLGKDKRNLSSVLCPSSSSRFDNEQIPSELEKLAAKEKLLQQQGFADRRRLWQLKSQLRFLWLQYRDEAGEAIGRKVEQIWNTLRRWTTQTPQPERSEVLQGSSNRSSPSLLGFKSVPLAEPAEKGRSNLSSNVAAIVVTDSEGKSKRGDKVERVKSWRKNSEGDEDWENYEGEQGNDLERMIKKKKRFPKILFNHTRN